LRITMLYPPRPGGRGTNQVPPVGLLYLGAVLEELGHDVILLDAARTGLDGDALVAGIAASNPDLLMISAFTSDVPEVAGLLPSIRKSLRAGVPIWLGGPHACCRGRNALSDLPEIDAVFVGEAEESLPAAVRHLSGEGERPACSIIWRDSPSDVEPAIVEQLGSLPIPAWHLAPPGLYRGLPNGVVLKRHPFAPILTTRGCPCRCTFCAGFRITGRKVRHRPLEQVWKEIELLVGTYGVREIHIEDDNFTFDRQYARDFCAEAIRRKLPVLYSTPNGIRLDTLDDELVGLMKAAGWYVVHCGIESGSDRVLQLVRKGTTTALVLEKIRLLRKHGLRVAGYFILGLPGETEEDMRMTIEFARNSGLHWAQFAAFLPIPGSEAGDAWLASHDMPATGWQGFHNTDCPAPPEGIERKRMKQIQRTAFLRFYLRPGPLLRFVPLLFHPGVGGRILSRAGAYLWGTRNRKAFG
jgi:anaerobic magnesium-protoporphyrin IX monomethyl ester cyclase